MTATTDVLDLVRAWTEAEQRNDAGAVDGVLAQQTGFQGTDNAGRFRLTLVAVRPTGRWLLAGAHIGMPQPPAGPPPRSQS